MYKKVSFEAFKLVRIMRNDSSSMFSKFWRSFGLVFGHVRYTYITFIH